MCPGQCYHSSFVLAQLPQRWHLPFCTRQSSGKPQAPAAETGGRSRGTPWDTHWDMLGHTPAHSVPVGDVGFSPPCPSLPQTTPPHAPTPPLLPAGPSLATLGLSKPRPSAASVGATQLAELQQPGAWGLCLRLGIAGHSSLWRLWGLKPPHSLATAGTASSTSSVPRHRLSDAVLRSEPGSLSAVIIRSPRWLPRLDLGSSGLGDGH